MKKHKLNLDKRKNYCLKLSEKLKQTETHLMRVLDMRRRDLNGRSKNMKGKNNENKTNKWNSSDPTKADNSLFAPKSEEIDSIKFLLEKMIGDKVQNSIFTHSYEEKVSLYSELMRSLVSEVKSLDKAKEDKKKSCIEVGTNSSYDKIIHEHQEKIEELELKTDLISTELENLKLKFPQFNKMTDEKDLEHESESDAMRIISNLSAPVTRTLL